MHDAREGASAREGVEDSPSRGDYFIWGPSHILLVSVEVDSSLPPGIGLRVVGMLKELSGFGWDPDRISILGWNWESVLFPTLR